jgi:dolichyl-phosphate-mannose--protein O-mannosyl transferase
MKNKRLIGILITVGMLLLIPFIAMQFTNEVAWSLFDFVVAAILLLGTGLLCEFVLRKVNKTKHRLVICAIILALLVLTWMELAVGLFGTPFEGS